MQQGGARAGSSSTLASLLKKPFQHLLVCTLFRRVSQTRNNLTGMKGERKRCLDFEQLLATRSFRSIRHSGRVGNGWKRLESISIHLTYPFHAHAVFLTIKIHKGFDEMKCCFRVGCCTLFGYLSSCTLCLRSKLQEKIEWQKFVSCTSRPHVMCGPLAVKVATCSLLPGHHHLSCLNLAILSIANNSRELTIASFHSVED